MKKFAWIAILLALSLAFMGCSGDDDDESGGKCEYEDCDCAECEGEGCECKKPGDGDKPEPLIINNPVFAGWGGMGSTGNNNTFNFSNTKDTNCRATYSFPAGAATYTHFEITFDLTKADDDLAGKQMKLIFGDRSKDEWGDSSDGWKGDSTFNEYKNFDDTSAERTYSHAISANKQLTIEQNWGSSKTDSANFTITITKIRFYNE